MAINRVPNVNTSIQTPSENIVTPDMAALKGLLAGAQGTEALMGREAQAKAMAEAAQTKNAGFADRNGINVGKDYEDKMKPYRQLSEDISKVESIMKTRGKDGKLLVTPQQIGDANAAIARIFSPNHMSDATVSRTEYESAPANFAAAIQKWTADPQDVGSRDLINHLVNQAHHLGNVSNQNALKELEGLDSGYTAMQEPSVRDLAKQKSTFFKQRFANKYPEIGAEGTPGGKTDMVSAPADVAKTATTAGKGLLQGILGKLGGGGPSVAAPQDPTQQDAAAPTGIPSFEDFKKMKAAGKL